MFKKTSLFLITTLLIGFSAKADEITSKDIVDLNPNHWSYSSSVKVIDKYKLIKCFPDHTFRGEKQVSLEDFSVMILKILKYYEKTESLDLKNTIEIPFKEEFFSKLARSKVVNEINELKNEYGFVIAFYDDKIFDPSREIDNYDVVLALNKINAMVLKGYEKRKNNPYLESGKVEKIEKLELFGKKDFPEKLFTELVKAEIISQDSLDSDEDVTRYRLCVIIDRFFDYLGKNKNDSR